MAVSNLLSNGNNESGLLPAKQKNKLISSNSNTGRAVQQRTNVRSMVELFNDKRPISKLTGPKSAVKSSFITEKQTSLLSSSVTEASMSQKHAINAGNLVRNSLPKPFSVERESSTLLPGTRERILPSTRAADHKFRSIGDKSPAVILKLPENNNNSEVVKPSVARKSAIAKSVNYFEHKIDNNKTTVKGPPHSPGNRELGSSLSEPSSGPNLTRRLKNDAMRFSLNENSLKRNNLQKPAVPVRPRVNTSFSCDLEKKQSPKLSSGLREKVKNLEEELKKEVFENPGSSSPRSTSPSPKLGPKGGLPPRPVNPVPKPQRTFTFKHRDHNANVTSPPPKPPPSRMQKSSLNSSSDVMKEQPTSAREQSRYEEVVFFGTADDLVLGVSRHKTAQSQKWDRSHVYEDVMKFSNQDNDRSTENYDRIDLTRSPTPHRPHSLSDSSDGYAHLQFLDLEKPKPPQRKISLLSINDITKSNSSTHPMLKKHPSDSGQMITSRSEQNLVSSNGKLQIADKIRDAFSVIGRKYKRSRKLRVGGNGGGGETNNSTSSGEDSDEETDINQHYKTLERVRTLQNTYRKTLKYKSLERELSGAGEQNVTLFEQVLVCKIVPDKSSGKISSKVIYRFPAPPPGKPIGDESTLAQFCFPDINELTTCTSMDSQIYSFMLTRENGTRKFGYCRRVLPPSNKPHYPVVYCLISALGSFGLYETIVTELETRHRVSIKSATRFLESLFVERFPVPGRSIRIMIEEPGEVTEVILRRPLDTRLEHVDLQCLLYELGITNTIKVFSSLLLERRVIICGRSLGILTACVHALRELLYPFVWQHVFIPVLPPPMIDLCCSPTPLLVGILESSVGKLKFLPLEEVFTINLSTKEIVSDMGDELEILPKKLQTALTNALAEHTNSTRDAGTQPRYAYATDFESAQRNTVISESFMHLFVEMIGHYQTHFQPVTNVSTTPSRHGTILRTFNRDSFYEDVTSSSVRRFLDLFMETQMFDGFIHSRELESYFEGTFEERIARHLLTVDDKNLNFKVLRSKMKRFVQSAITVSPRKPKKGAKV